MKVAFFVQHMIVGGVEKSLIELTKVLSKNGNKITIYVIKKKGDLQNCIPSNINCLEIPMKDEVRDSIAIGGIKVSMKEAINSYDLRKIYMLSINYLKNLNEFTELRVDFDNIPVLEEKFDIVVNYHIHSPFLVRYVAEKVKSHKKFTWIHNDFYTTGYNINRLYNYLNYIDRFFCVSLKLKDEFTNLFPEFLEKTEVAHNIVPSQEIIVKADEFRPIEFEHYTGLKILSVGRLEEQKGYDIAIRACKKLKEDGLHFHWFIIGEGTLKHSIEREINKRELKEYMHLLGVKLNPYPYIKNADVLVQSSRHEGWGIIVSEAKILNVPIVSTDVAGAKEQLKDGFNGTVVDINEESLYNGIKKLLCDADLRKKYIAELRKENNNEVLSWISWFQPDS